MVRYALLALMIGLHVAVDAAPQAPPTAPPGGARGGRGGPAYVSPEVAGDRRITFRFLAPSAQQVTVAGELDGRSYPMTKDAGGIWSVTVGPLGPDIYTYSFNVDGVTALDPRNPNTKYGYGNFGAVSVVQVPDDQPAFYDVRPVPHGEVRIRPYVSKTMGVARTLWVYTPPNYDRGSNFPVLYLMHGGGDIESGWTMVGRANNILDNLIADGRARPMVVVMPLGHTVQSFWAGPVRPSPNGLPAGGRGQPPAPAGLNLFGRELIDEVLPLVEATYKVSKRSDDRAIGGLSMGGGLTMNVAFTRPELFRHVVIMSAGSTVAEQMYPAFFANPVKVNRQFKTFWIATGKDDALTGAATRALVDALDARSIKHTYRVTEGRHEWTVWRHHLREVAPLLFR